MLDEFRSYFLPVAIFLLFVIAIIGWLCLRKLSEINDESILYLYNYLERTDARNLSELQRHVNRLDEGLSRIEGNVNYSASSIHALAAHFVQRLRTKTDIQDEQSYLEDVRNSEDVESLVYQELAQRRAAAEEAQRSFNTNARNPPPLRSEA